MQCRFGSKAMLLARSLILVSLLQGISGGVIGIPVRAAVECEIPGPTTSLTGTATPGEDQIEATPLSPRAITRNRLEKLVQAVSACKTAADFETMSRLVTERYLGQVYGGGPRLTRETFLAIADTLPTPRIRFREFDDLVITGPGAARANVRLVVGNQVTFERLTFVEDNNRPGFWLIDSTAPLRVRPPRNHDRIDVTMTGNQYTPAVLTAANATVDIRAANDDSQAHELLVLQLADSVTTGALLLHIGPDFPDGVAYLGQVTIPAQSSGNMVLVGLKPGTYTIVDLLPSANGVPHLSLGMQATLTITGD